MFPRSSYDQLSHIPGERLHWAELERDTILHEKRHILQHLTEDIFYFDDRRYWFLIDSEGIIYTVHEFCWKTNPGKFLTTLHFSLKWLKQMLATVKQKCFQIVFFKLIDFKFALPTFSSGTVRSWMNHSCRLGKRKRREKSTKCNWH